MYFQNAATVVTNISNTFSETLGLLPTIINFAELVEILMVLFLGQVLKLTILICL